MVPLFARFCYNIRTIIPEFGENMLEIKELTGGYVNIPVLKDVSFEVGNGQLVGLIGLNGAGKSTTINEIIGLLTPYKGQIQIDGLELRTNPSDYRKKIGFIPETPSLYEELTLREHIETVAMAYDIEQERAFKRVDKLLEMFRLKEKLDWFPVHFSKGMKQKVMIICAFVVDPSLFIVDEPFLGLDPVAIADLIQLLDEEKKKGKSILMSTHVLDSAEKMCDSFVILHKGQVRAKGSLAELRAQFQMPDTSLNDIYLALTEEAAL
ncbi:ABC superfamily ATP binding cassette transporter, ABC protein [Streptococcus sanguinis SK115]|uniref:ABC superfamily ATP binding cassette transporter, ABC protein n=2 Tax=Streptococcus sanguinis TaxID=1305 RepID=F0IBP3_STRSA|nr:ABC superfamily ATP binding cassette transporter, ABC protein [Streptococcus sanguinis SK115]